MLDKNKFTVLMTGLSEMFNKPLSDFLMDMYYDILKDYSYEQVGRAVKSCLKNYKYATLPKPADILEYIEGSSEDKSLIAWLKAKEAVEKGGYVATIEFDDPIISHCLHSLGGWQWFCDVHKNELPFVEKRFRELYNMYRKRDITKPMKLIGFIENKNSETGYLEAIPEPTRIGFEEEIKQIGR